MAVVRPYRPSDLPALYDICLKTADNGADATHLYGDHRVVGEIFAAPYAVLEPDHALVAEDAEGIAGYILGAVAHHDGMMGVQVLQGRSDDGRFTERNTFHGCFIIRRTVDSLEEAVDAMVRQNGAGKPLGFLGGHRHRLPGFGEGLQEFTYAGVQPALGDAGRHVIPAVPADHLVQHGRRDVGHVEQ